MNLFYLAIKGDKNVVRTETAVPATKRVGQASWRGFEIQPGIDPQLRVRHATRWYPFRERPDTVGWYAGASQAHARLSLWFSEPDSLEPVLPRLDLELGDALAPVQLPWALSADPHPADLDLVMHVSGGPVFLASHRGLHRQAAIALCKGRGVEIGPGSHPQILPGPEVEVSYVEQMPPAEWNRLYNPKAKGKVDTSLWDNYIVGDAHDIPVPNGSLDFIFLSHVFEHLANPLRHLEIWASKLRQGGRVVAIVPDFIGSKDYAADPCELRDFIAEYESGDLAPTRASFERYARLRGKTDGGAKMWEDRFSIHVHFYSNSNMARLLEEAVRRFDYQDFSIMHTPNHKDFYFVLVR